MDRFRSTLSSITGERKPTRDQEVELEPRAMSCDKLAMEVTGVQGERLGKIEDIMLDHLTGRVAYVMATLDALPGAGDKLFPIPWEAFALSTARERLILNIPRERLQNAPSIEKSEWQGEPGRGWITAVYNYYGFIPYWSRRK